MVRLVCVVAFVLGCTKSPEATPAPPTIVPPADATHVAPPADAMRVDAAIVVDAAPPPPPDAIAVAAPAGPPVLASCPKTYAIAAAGTCALASADTLSCTYPDGHCGCSTFRPCAGWAGAYEEARKHPKAAWSCTPKLRDDGCLGDPPAVGSKCAHDGKQCMYGSCGGEVLVCRSGAWAIGRRISPPP